jgi:MFS family permease
MPYLLNSDINEFTESAFIGGVSGLGVISLCAGFVNDTIPVIVLRALCGIGKLSRRCDGFADEDRFSASSMTIPSALTLLVNVFPEPLEQARAIGLFGGCGCVANGEHPTQLIIHD